MHTAVFILHLRLAAELYRASPPSFFCSPPKIGVVFLTLKSTGYDAFGLPPRRRGEGKKKKKRSRMLLVHAVQTSISFMPYLVLRERKQNKTKKNKWGNMTSQERNIYMYKVMYTIYSNTFQNRQTLKSLAKISIYFFFSTPLGNLLLSRLYNICIYE